MEKLKAQLLETAKMEGVAKKAAEKSKRVWKEAVAEQKARHDALIEKVAKARRKMDQAAMLLGDAQTAKTRLVAEFTPRELQEKEAKSGHVFRSIVQRRKVAERDVATMRESHVLRSRRRGFLQPDKETLAREADRLTFLESTVAELLTAEKKAQVLYESVCEALNAAYAEIRVVTHGQEA